MSTLEATREEIAKVASLVVTARKLLAGGALLDLEAVEERVRALCTNIDTMAKSESVSLRDDAAALIDRLTLLEEDLRDHLGQIRRDQVG